MKKKIVLILILFCFLSACFSNQVLLTNETEAVKEDLHLFAGSDEIWSGQLKAGEQKKISFDAKGDGAFSLLQGLDDGSMYHVKELGYFTPRDGQRHELVLKKQNRVFYQLGK